MAKYCPLTKEKVLYLECLECESRDDCEQGNLKHCTEENTETQPNG